jgi:glycosyltransferase involved in cell wall biosynthesis
MTRRGTTSSHLSVLLATEGTYPFYSGGVSTWCQNLTQKLPKIDFRVFAVTTNPFSESRYELSKNVLDVVKAPLWGTMQPADYSWHQSVAHVFRGRFEATYCNLRRDYLPIWDSLLGTIFPDSYLDDGKDQLRDLAATLVEMHILFATRYNYQKVWACPIVWEAFRYFATRVCAGRPLETFDPTLAELKQAYRLLYHFLSVLCFPIPHADVSHSSAAGFCGLPCVIARVDMQRPYLLTEHGVYLREQYLNLRRGVKSLFVRWFMYRVFTLVAQLNYHFADQVSPVCAFNARWERELGTAPEKIKIIYNGCDPKKFHPHPLQAKTRPLVSTVGLIYELKGQLDLIEAAHEVKQVIPDVEFRLYGVPSDEKYYAMCVEKVKEYQLEENVYFKGITKSPSEVYSHADVIAFSSISEGFPYVVVEAMLSGAAIVSTDVGGVREALDNAGVLVRSRSPHELAQAIILLLESPEERQRLGELAIARALSKFTEERFLENYRGAYDDLANVSVRERNSAV